MTLHLCNPSRHTDALKHAQSLSDDDQMLRRLGDLEVAFANASPRQLLPPTPWPSIVIHSAVLLISLILVFRTFNPNGLFGWSAGLAYIAYDCLLIGFVFVMTLPLLRSARVPRVIDQPPSLSALVAAYNEAPNLGSTLRALLAQSAPVEMILIVDDGSDDATADILTSEFGLLTPRLGSMSVPSTMHNTLHWLRLPHGGKARALNVAILSVNTDLVLTVDGDTVLGVDAVGAMKEAFAFDSTLVAATGVLTPVCSKTFGHRFLQWFQTYEYIRNFLARYAWARSDSLLLISGACAGFRREAVISVGGFDPECLVEDYELIHRLRRYGAVHGKYWTTGIVPGANAITDAPSTIGTFLRQRRRWFGGFLQTQFWYRDMVGNPRYGRVGLVMLPIKALDSLQPIYGLIALALLPFYVVKGRWSLLLPIGALIAAKIAIDFAFSMWSIHLYRRWVDSTSTAKIIPAVLAFFIEPFTYQVARHMGAALGWLTFLSRAIGRGNRCPEMPAMRKPGAWISNNSRAHS